MRMIATALLLAVVPVAAAAQDLTPNRRTVTVSTQASVTREPDRAVIMLAVESQAETAEEAAATNAELMTRVLAAVREAGIPERQIRTTSYALHPVYSQPNHREMGPEPFEPTIIGYRAMNMVRVEVDDIPATGGVIDAALNAGANRVDGVSFELRNGDTAYNEALGNAIRKARAQADAAAQAAGQTIGPPLNIAVGGGYMPPPAPMMYREAVMAAGADMRTPVQPGTLEVHASVTITYELLGG